MKVDSRIFKVDHEGKSESTKDSGGQSTDSREATGLRHLAAEGWF